MGEIVDVAVLVAEQSGENGAGVLADPVGRRPRGRDRPAVELKRRGGDAHFAAGRMGHGRKGAASLQMRMRDDLLGPEHRGGRNAGAPERLQRVVHRGEAREPLADDVAQRGPVAPTLVRRREARIGGQLGPAEQRL